MIMSLTSPLFNSLIVNCIRYLFTYSKREISSQSFNSEVNFHHFLKMKGVFNLRVLHNLFKEVFSFYIFKQLLILPHLKEEC